MKKIFTILVLMLIISGQIFAVPADPTPKVFTQPDGKDLTILTKGDERIHWHETLDGYTLLYNNDGYLTYAQLDEYGNLISSDFIATNIEERDFAVRSFLQSIGKNLWFSDTQQQVILQVWQIEDEATAARGTSDIVGEYKTICAFVQFPEKSFIKDMSLFENLFNQIGYSQGSSVGSVRDFYREVSYGKLDLEITLCGPYTAPQSSAYYAGSDGTANCRELARWLAQQVVAEPGIDLRNYDANGDNLIDGFHFIYAGLGQANSSCTTCIWPHKSQFTPPVSQNGKYIYIYSCSPELNTGTNITTIGVICHEMCHAVCGAADYYDTDGNTGGSYNGTGDWDLMASGNYNGNASGNRPAHPNMYIKTQIGWVTPRVLDSPLTVINMPNSSENPIAYKINTGVGNEHYILENIQRVGFNTNVPGSGLLIYHVANNPGSQCVNCTHPQKMYPVCAVTQTPIPTGTPSSYGNINSSNAPFPGSPSSGRNSFTSTSTPTMFAWTNTPIDKPLTEIVNTTSTKTVSFKFMGGGEEYTVTVSANPTDGGTVTGGGTFAENTPVTVRATANEGFIFTNWTRNNVEVCSTPEYTFIVTEDVTLVANFGVRLSDNANLATLTVSEGELTPAFLPTHVTYTVEVEYEIETISITGIAEDEKATVTGNVTDYAISVGNTDFEITVTAEDNSTKIYTVTVTRKRESGIDEYQVANYKIYPNPANSSVTIESENLIHELTIFDALGKKLQDIKNINEKSYQLDVNNYPNATYYLQIDGVSMKLIVNR